MEVALAHWGKATLVSAWQAWREHTLYASQRRQVIARALQHFLNRTQAAAFRQWLEVVQRKKDGASKAAVCLQRLLNGRLSAAFQGWREAACELQDKRQRMQQAAAHFLNQRLAICFLTWRAASEEALLGAAKLEHAVGHWLHGTAAKVFNAWREWAHFKAYSKPILSGLSLVVIACCMASSMLCGVGAARVCQLHGTAGKLCDARSIYACYKTTTSSQYHPEDDSDFMMENSTECRSWMLCCLFFLQICTGDGSCGSSRSYQVTCRGSIYVS